MSRLSKTFPDESRSSSGSRRRPIERDGIRFALRGAEHKRRRRRDERVEMHWPAYYSLMTPSISCCSSSNTKDDEGFHEW